MLFNSLHYLLFFPVVAILFYATPHRFRWVLLLAASYYFYGSWRIEYLLLIILSTLVDFWSCLQMGDRASPAERRPYLFISLSFNLGLLALFKYSAFATTTVRELFHAPIPVPHLLLPVGLSFYTFQALSYSIDVYRGTKTPERRLGIFALFVSFFPQLVAGPIERSTHLLPQFHRQQMFDYQRVAGGLQRIAWGFFKKLVIADQAALIVDAVYKDPLNYPGQTVLLAAYLFAFQVYCDFSGYSDIAIGSARVLGFDLIENFRRPFASKSIAEFWTRWHISLSTWFRDYVYIPLGGSRAGTGRHILNLLIVFTLSGLWHGAAWRFAAWGLLNGVLLVLSRLTASLRDKAWALFPAPSVRAPLAVLATFHLLLITFVVFRAGPDTLTFLQRIPHFQTGGWGLDSIINDSRLVLLIAAIVCMEVGQYLHDRYDLAALWSGTPGPVRWSTYYAAVLFILIAGETGAREFFYFQF